jgi:hypothetical protein
MKLPKGLSQQETEIDHSQLRNEGIITRNEAKQPSNYNARATAESAIAGQYTKKG